jgi:hypothetical protein
MARDVHPAKGCQVVGIEPNNAWWVSDAASLHWKNASSYRVSHESRWHPVDRLSGVSKRRMEGARPVKTKPERY